MAEKRAVKFDWLVNDYAISSLPNQVANDTKACLNMLAKINRVNTQIVKVLENHAKTLETLAVAQKIEGWNANASTKAIVNPALVGKILNIYKQAQAVIDIVKIDQVKADKVITLEQLLGLTPKPEQPQPQAEQPQAEQPQAEQPQAEQPQAESAKPTRRSHN